MNMGADGSILDCSACDSPKTVHPECWPIPIPSSDPFFPAVKDGKKQCLHFARSLNAQTKLGPREQVIYHRPARCRPLLAMRCRPLLQ